MRHLDDEALAELALHPDQPVEAGVADHLAHCQQCRGGLASLRHTRKLVADADLTGFTSPPPAVWSAVREAMAAPPEPASPVPSPAHRPAAGRRTWVLAAAAALVGIVLGAFGGRLFWSPAVQPAPEVILATARLDTLDTGVQQGTAVLVDTPTGVELRVTTTPFAAPGGYLEVWLINADGVRMVSVGQLANGTSGVFPVPKAVIDSGYVIVDISREALDDKPQHSGDSVVRGKLLL